MSTLCTTLCTAVRTVTESLLGSGSDPPPPHTCYGELVSRLKISVHVYVYVYAAQKDIQYQLYCVHSLSVINAHLLFILFNLFTLPVLHYTVGTWLGCTVRYLAAL